MMTDLALRSGIERKRPLVRTDALISLKLLISENTTLNNNFNEYRFRAEHHDEIEKTKQKDAQMFANEDLFSEHATKSDLTPTTPRRVITLKEYTARRNVQPPGITNTVETNLNTLKRIVIPSAVLYEEGEIVDSGENDSIGTPELLPLSGIQLTPIHFDQMCLAPIRQIITSSQSHLNEFRAKQKHDLAAFSLPNDTENGHRANSSTNTLSLVTAIPSEMLDCCQDIHPTRASASNENNPEDWTNCQAALSLRETMIHISKRLIKTQAIPIVDTHCHFDLIFGRLQIQHNDLQRYFHEYKDFYPEGLSFELAIHVFWRPRHLTANNWTNRYSNYLLDNRVYGACGIHPHWSSFWNESSCRDVERCLKHPKIVALGEIGLDFGPKNTCNVDQQCRAFAEQLELAAKWSKPVVIHSRNSYEQTFKIMKQCLDPTHRIHLHCFVGTLEDVHLFTSYFTDIKFGFTPVITRGKSLHKVIEQLDLRQILSETDSPYFIPEELAKLTRCAHPGMVYSVVEIIAQIRQLPIEKVAYQLRENTRQIYGI